MTGRKFPQKNTLPRNPLKPVCVTGAILALIAGLALFGLMWWRDTPVQEKSSGSAFSRELKDYDLFDAPKRALAGENPARIEKRLSRLQKQAQGLEEQLSVLKRWRSLALVDRRYMGGYEKAAREAAETFASSAPLALVASEAAVSLETAVSDGGSLSGDARARLRSYASRLSQNHFGNLELGLHILAGDLENSGQALGVPELLNLSALDFSGLPEQTRNDLLTDEFLLKAVKGDNQGASAVLNVLLAAAPETGPERMAAEFFYDNGNPLKAAELFSRLGGERDLARSADALVLAGEIPGARNIWLALSSAPAGDTSSADISSRYLYNLAASSNDAQEETAWLEKLFTQRNREGKKTTGDNAGVFSIIRYTRLLDTSRATAVLDDAGMTQNPLLDLELLRRRLDTLPPTRAAAEVWMLLERHPDAGPLYEWAAWYFDFQKLYSESPRLLTEAARNGITGPWYEFHQALALVREGKTAEGEKALKEAGNHSADWRIPANLGSIQESRRDISSALAYYETAATLISNQMSRDQSSAEKPSAALVQMRLSRCLEGLGRGDESRRALEYAQELDPANLDIRRELRRLNNK